MLVAREGGWEGGQAADGRNGKMHYHQQYGTTHSTLIGDDDDVWLNRFCLNGVFWKEMKGRKRGSELAFIKRVMSLQLEVGKSKSTTNKWIVESLIQLQTFFFCMVATRATSILSVIHLHSCPFLPPSPQLP